MGGTSFDAALVKDGAPLVMTDGGRRPLAARAADDRHPHDRRRRRLDRAASTRAACCTSARRAPAPSPGPPATAAAARADRHRRRPRARLPRRGELPRRRDAARPRGGRAGDREPRRAAARARASSEAAAGVYDVVNVTMATGVREVSVRRGLDPRDFPLVVAGGAGPVHAAAIARRARDPAAARAARVVDLLRRRAC